MLARAPLAVACLAPGALSAAPLDCVIEPKAIIDLVTSEQGRIEAVAVSRGDRVAKGDLLVQLDDAVQRLQVELARARVGSDVNIRAAQARLALRQKELERANQLKQRNVAATTTVEDAEIEAALSALALEEAEIARQFAGIEEKQAEAVLARRRIASPVDGVVVSVEAAPGEYAHDQLKLLTIAEIDPLHVEVFVPAEYYNQVDPGDVYQVSQIAPLEGSYPATVTVVDPVFDAASGTFGVQLEIDNPDGSIPAGTRCMVDLDNPLPAGG